MKKNKKLWPVGQWVQHDDIIGGIVYIISGFCFLCKGLREHLVLMALLAAPMCIFAVSTVIKYATYEPEKMDEMASENMNHASRIVLTEFMMLGVVILVADAVCDILRIFFSVEIPWSKYFTYSPTAYVCLFLGFQMFMTGFHFRKLERE